MSGFNGFLACLQSNRRKPDVPPPVTGLQTYSAPHLFFDALTVNSLAAQSRQAMDWQYPTYLQAFLSTSQGTVTFVDYDTRWNETNAPVTLPSGVVIAPGQPYDAANMWFKVNDPGNGLGGIKQQVYGQPARDRVLRTRAKRTEAITLSPYVKTTPGGVITKFKRDAPVLDKVDNLFDMMRQGIVTRLFNALRVPTVDSEYDFTIEDWNGGPVYTWRYNVQQCEATAMVREMGYPAKMVMGLDGGSSATRAYTADPAHPAKYTVDALLWLFKTYPDIWYTRKGRDGIERKVLAAWAPDFMPANAGSGARTAAKVAAQKAYTDDLLASLKAAGEQVIWTPNYQAGSWVDRYNEVSPGDVDIVSRWGDRDAATLSAETLSNALMGNQVTTTAPGREYMALVIREDIRADQLQFWEAEGFNTLLASAKSATGDATHRGGDLWHIPTGSDYRENAQYEPTRSHGWTPGKLGLYLMQKWQTGIEPTPTKDWVAMSRRTQFCDRVMVGATQVHLRHQVPTFADLPPVNAPATDPEFEARKNQGVIVTSTDTHYYWDGAAWVDLGANKFPNTYLTYNQGGAQRPQRDLMGWLRGGTDSSDRCWFVTVSKSTGATLEMTNTNGVVTTVTLGTGLQVNSIALAGEGTTSAVIKRAGTTVATVPASSIPPVKRTLTRQNLKYWFSDSLPAPDLSSPPPLTGTDPLANSTLRAFDTAGGTTAYTRTSRFGILPQYPDGGVGPQGLAVRNNEIWIAGTPSASTTPNGMMNVYDLTTKALVRTSGVQPYGHMQSLDYDPQTDKFYCTTGTERASLGQLGVLEIDAKTYAVTRYISVPGMNGGACVMVDRDNRRLIVVTGGGGNPKVVRWVPMEGASAWTLSAQKGSFLPPPINWTAADGGKTYASGSETQGGFVHANRLYTVIHWWGPSGDQGVNATPPSSSTDRVVKLWVTSLDGATVLDRITMPAHANGDQFEGEDMTYDPRNGQVYATHRGTWHIDEITLS